MLLLVCFAFTILIYAALVMSRPLSEQTLRLRLLTGMQNRSVLRLATFARANIFSSCTVFMCKLLGCFHFTYCLTGNRHIIRMVWDLFQLILFKLQ